MTLIQTSKRTALCAFLLLVAKSTFIAQTGAALSFDGVNDNAMRPVLSTATNSITIEAKVLWNGPSSGNKIIVNNGNNGGNGYGFFIPSNSNQVNWIYGGLSFSSAFALTPGVWTSMAMVINSNTLTIYKDGVVVVNGVVSPPATPNGSFTIGCDLAGGSPFNGSIDEVRFWNVLRSACDINNFLTCEIPTNAPGLLANYHFNQGIAGGSNSTVTSLLDATSNANHVPLTNFAMSGSSSNWVSPGAVVSGYSVSNVPSLTVSPASATICAGNSTTLNATGQTDLVMYYRLNEGSGTTTQDLSGNNLTGTLTNSPTWGASTATFTGASNTMTFNSGYVTVADNPVFASLQTNLSIEAWIYQTDNVNNTVIDRANYNFLFQACPNGQTGLGFYNNNGGWTYSSGTIPINQWVHVAMSYEGATGYTKFYLNGVLLSTHTRPTPLTFNAGPVNIGRQEPLGCQCNTFTGAMDEVKVWRSVRNQTQIQASLTSTILPMAFAYSPTLGLSAGSGASVVANPTASTVYNSTITNASGCTASVSNSINVLARPTISVNSGSVCSGKSFTIVPAGANTYTIQGGNTVVSPTANANYTVTGTNTAGCVSQTFATASVSVLSLPVISVNSGSICSGQSFTLLPSGANTYTIQGGNTVVSPTANTTYTVTGTNSLGCVSASAAAATVSVDLSPTISIANGTVCSGTSYTLSPSGANSYTFQGGNAVVTPTANTTFTIIGSSTAGCPGVNTATANLTVNALPVLVTTSSNSFLCLGNSSSLTVAGAATYSWSNGSTATLINVSPSLTTTYSVMGTDANNCSASSSITINVSNCTNLSNNADELLGVEVFPNPSHGWVNLNLGQTGLKRVIVFNYLGELINTIESESATEVLDLNGLSKGIYIIRITSQHQSANFRLILN